jgi:hypothetical protein
MEKKPKKELCQFSFSVKTILKAADTERIKKKKKKKRKEKEGIEARQQ